MLSDSSIIDQIDNIAAAVNRLKAEVHKIDHVYTALCTPLGEICTDCADCPNYVASIAGDGGYMCALTGKAIYAEDLDTENTPASIPPFSETSVLVLPSLGDCQGASLRYTLHKDGIL